MKEETKTKEDCHKQFFETEKEIEQHENMLALIEPGYWRRMLMGSLFWLIEVLFYLIIAALLIGAFMFDINSLTHTNVSLSESTRIEVGMDNDTLNTISFCVRVILLGTALLTLLFCCLLRSSRKNLFKLAEVSGHLHQTLENAKNRRDQVMEELEKVN